MLFCGGILVADAEKWYFCIILANIVTEYYMMLYNDYMMYINNDGNLNTSIDLETVKHYKSLAQRIQSIYNYVNFIFTFENPYKTRKNK